MKFHAPGDLLRGRFKLRKRVGCRTVQNHADQHHHACVQYIAIEQRNNSFDDARLFQPLDTPQTGGRAQFDFLGEGHIGNRGVTLQCLQDSAVDPVQQRRCINAWLFSAFIYCFHK
ncbi:Glyoxylase or a related metal-dependent hydrolase [Pseudomonas syringae pv. actinidiae]|uniref:Glyoxylase or a related metal-dependent hydrolase n=1 Tax=Pseudomonas syringae pv. actinidiae TaxID=103796 RepID=A0A2V0QFX8_PSESF|nr:Glyoxylase or a related metal-dependent hydrolase [Pseudomonas syringae pv. actinidiae]GBH18875.1 Glyoxylase or a related metal-dependent hydrolase [Pseudomonas syringae pv. actinidiae]